MCEVWLIDGSFLPSLPPDPLNQPTDSTYRQVLKPVTRQKICVEGDQFLAPLAEVLGGLEKVPAYMGGRCTCTICAARGQIGVVEESVVVNREVLEEDDDDDDDLNSDIRGCNSVLTTAILAFLVLWILVAMLAGFHE